MTKLFNFIIGKSFAILVILILSQILFACSPPGKRGSRFVRKSGHFSHVKKSSSSTKLNESATRTTNVSDRGGVKVRVLLASYSKLIIRSPRYYEVSLLNSGKVLKKGKRKLVIRKLGKRALRIRFSKKIFSVNGAYYRGELILHRSRGKILAINELSLEHYLYGVVGSEMNKSWPLEALKAQAIAARTFAWRRIQYSRAKKFQLRKDTSAQVYKGLARESERIRLAVNSTKDIIATYKGRAINAFFHSSCGGILERAKNVWGNRDPTTQVKRSHYCKGSKTYAWRTFASRKRLNRMARKLGLKSFRKFSVLKKSSSGRAMRIRVYGPRKSVVLKGNNFRLKLGADLLRSLRFKARFSNSGVRFVGRGWGHGVGMCQYGAKKMAEKNISASKILSYYFRNIRLQKIRRSKLYALKNK